MAKVVGTKKMVPEKVEIPFKEFFKILEEKDGCVEEFTIECSGYRVNVGFHSDIREIDYTRGVISFGFNPDAYYSREEMFEEVK